jgi:hypothetical protein
VVTRTFYDSGCARISDSETFTAYAIEIGFAPSRTVQNGVADNDVVGSKTTEIIGRANNDASARYALTNVIVPFAH